MSAQEYMQYERSRLAILENKAIVDTARAEERERFIVNCISQGLSIELTATLSNSTILIVKEVMKRYNLKLKG